LVTVRVSIVTPASASFRSSQARNTGICATGAVKTCPAVYPSGSSASSAGRTASTASFHHGGASGDVVRSIPSTIVTPVSGSRARSLKTRKARRLQPSERSGGPQRNGYQTAAAMSEVVAGVRSRAAILTLKPASTRRSAVVNPETPAPTTTASRVKTLRENEAAMP
jgi:hypothetical protein